MSTRHQRRATTDGSLKLPVTRLDAHGGAVLDGPGSSVVLDPPGVLGSERSAGPRSRRRSTREPSSRGDVRTRTGVVALAGLLVSGLLVVLAAAHTESLLPLTIRPVPAAMAGVFGGLNLDLHAGGAIAVLLLMFCSYAVVVANSHQLTPRMIIGAIVALNVLVLLGPPLISTDVFSYQAYARMGAQYGINPYLHGPDAILDSIYPYVGSKWSSTSTAYGPLFTVFSYAFAKLSIASSAFVYKAVAALADVALVAVVWRCAQHRGIDPKRAVALVGLNPLLVVYGVGGGHNDLLMLLAMAGAVYALVGGRERLGGVLGIVAISIKLTGGLLLPFALVAGGSERGRGRRRDLLLGAVAGLAVIAALSFAVFGSGTFHLLETLRQGQKEGNWNSIPGFISSRLHLVTVSDIATYVLAAAFVGTCGWLLWRVWSGRMDWIAGAGWATLAMLVASSSLLPWYVAWMLPLAALGRDRRLAGTAVVMTGIVQAIQLLGYVPHHTPLF